MIKKDTINLMKKFNLFLFKQKKRLFLLLVLNVLIVFTSVISPYFISKLITFVLEINYKKVFYMLFIIGMIKIFNLVLLVFNSKVFYNIRSFLLTDLKTSISNSVLNYDMTTFSLNGKGKIFQRINNDPDKLGILINELSHCLIYLFTNFGIIFLIFLINLPIGIIYFIFTLLVFFIRNYGIKKKMELKKLSYELQEDINNNFSEILNGFGDIKRLNMKYNFSKKNNYEFKNIEEVNKKAEIICIIFDKLAYVVESIGTIIVLFISMYFYKNNILSMDNMLSIFIYRSSVFSFSDNINNFNLKLSEFKLTFERILEIISFDIFKLDVIENKKCRGNIEFKKVDFSYDNNLFVLKDCSLKINENEKVLIVGDSGSGKTTIFNLISKIFNVPNNKIFIDGNDINNLSEDYIRKHITVISQYYYLFDMSIKDNFLLVKNDATDKEIIDVCKMVGIHDFIISLPLQYDTVIGSGGFNLSGGQRQRLAIARTLLLNSKIILFDEVTSSLDSTLEKLIMDLINKLGGKHTIIVISHNINFFSSFDKILVLNNKKIISHGSHQYLLKHCKKYKELFNNSKIN